MLLTVARNITGVDVKRSIESAESVECKGDVEKAE